jgi:hypothetical protein
MLPEPTPAAGEFDSTELQGGLLMQVENVHQPVLKPRGPWEPVVKVRLTKNAGDQAYGGKSRSFANGPPRRLIG